MNVSLLFHKGLLVTFLEEAHVLALFLQECPLLARWGAPPILLKRQKTVKQTGKPGTCTLCCCFVGWLCPDVRIFSSRAMGKSGRVNPLDLPISSTEEELKYILFPY